MRWFRDNAADNPSASVRPDEETGISEHDAHSSDMVGMDIAPDRLPKSKVMLGFQLVQAQVRDEVAAELVSIERLVRDAGSLAPMARHFFDGHKALIKRRVERIGAIAERIDKMGEHRAAVAMDISRLRERRRACRPSSQRYREISEQIEEMLGHLAAQEVRRTDMVMEGWMESREVVLSVRLLRDSIVKMAEPILAIRSRENKTEETLPNSADGRTGQTMSADRRPAVAMSPGTHRTIV